MWTISWLNSQGWKMLTLPWIVISTSEGKIKHFYLFELPEKKNESIYIQIHSQSSINIEFMEGEINTDQTTNLFKLMACCSNRDVLEDLSIQLYYWLTFSRRQKDGELLCYAWIAKVNSILSQTFQSWRKSSQRKTASIYFSFFVPDRWINDWSRVKLVDCTAK